jgi:eukaryotic-like serine/threonine-protein kinase
MARVPTAKDQLAGLKLSPEWRVLNVLTSPRGDTGGVFSTGYIVEHSDGKKCFLKAIDFSWALQAADPARALQELTAAFNLERDILDIGQSMSHVVTKIADGSTIVVTTRGSETVQYFILELAGDSLRRMAVNSRRLPISVALTALHNVSLGLRQLHGHQVAHQDIKPSNVLKFDGDSFKVCDVGRASIKGRNAPHDAFPYAGDPAYAPPELIYGQLDPEFNVRRLGCDAYLLGSLATFLICGMPMTALLMNELASTARPNSWGGTYKDILPQVRAAFSRVIDQLELTVPKGAPYRDALVGCIAQLCDPDPQLRGHPLTRAIQSGFGNVFDLERYISTFATLAAKARSFERRQAIP